MTSIDMQDAPPTREFTIVTVMIHETKDGVYETLCDLIPEMVLVGETRQDVLDCIPDAISMSFEQRYGVPYYTEHATCPTNKDGEHYITKPLK